MVKLAILLSEGFEEIEAVTTIDILRRASIQIDSILVDNKQDRQVKGSHDITLVADKLLQDFSSAGNQLLDIYDGIIYPGGPAVKNLLKNDEIVALAKQFNEKGKMVAAICAAPQILAKAGLLKNKRITHYPGCNQYMEESGAFVELEQAAIIDGDIVTGSSAGNCVLFALSIIEYFKGIESKADMIKQLVISPSTGTII
ncbi:hypothetical protein CYY_001647 [Polysphondylium violaceum]|uniref:DJ-1/PfpI domain-containing protein n=1 Tax=Polysphondylium violaceum TaxID=133409 RepID=A0A8J4Q0P7_9MYCE|nr:hypothetical protein CYY_001647 [Polysphondylium violaceum]